MTSCDSQLHLMVDLETLGHKPDTVVVSCGLVLFDRDGIKYEKELFLDVQSQLDDGRKVTESTLKWWLTRGNHLLKILEQTNKVEYSGLLSLVDNIFAKHKSCKIWSNASTFDIAILSNMYQAKNKEKPWAYWNEVCYRTFLYAHNIPKAKIPDAHNALADSKAQAQNIIAWAKGKGKAVVL